jgi:hypothetical protein
MSELKTSQRYPLPGMEPPLAALHDYWNSLKRGGWRIMPFADDVTLPDLGAVRANIVLFDVMEGRFRFAEVGGAVDAYVSAELEGKFLDEAPTTGALAGMADQCQATLAESAPTYAKTGGYARLLLPLWGNGTIQMLIGAIAKA